MNEQGQVLTAALTDGDPPLAELILDRGAGELRGEGGVERIDPKVMQVFTTLLDAGGEVVSRAALLETAWPGAVVSDEVLTRCIYALRRHLSGAGGSQRYRKLLETLPKRGYRLNLAPSAAAPIPLGRVGPRPTSLIGVAGIGLGLGLLALLGWLAMSPPESEPAPGAVATAAETPLGIAVLPFVNRSNDPDEQYFADGLSEELISLLAKTLDIRVIARTSSFAFRDGNEDIGTIAAHLGVSHVLEGSVRKDGDQLRITAQLIDAQNSSHVWSDTFDRHSADRFAVQDEIAFAVARALQLELASVPVPQPVPTANPLAHEAYLRGRFLFHRRADGDAERALGYFEEAVRIDPDFALAWANLAGALHVLEHEDGSPPAGTAERLRAAIERALALGPGSAEVHARAAQYYASNNEPERAEEHFRTAQSLDPDSPIVLSFLAGRASWRGDFDEAVTLQQRALVLDPLSSVYAANLIVLLLAAGRAEEAGTEIEKLRTERSSLLPVHQHELASALILQDRIEDAEALVESWPEGNERLQYRAMLLYNEGRSEEADEAMAKLEGVPGLEGAVRRAEVHAFRGELDRCFEELETLRRHLESVERNLPPRPWIDRARHSPYLNTTLAADPRWSALWEDQTTPRQERGRSVGAAVSRER